MVCVPFKYVAVESYDEAVRVLVEYGEEAKILAGGQSLVSMLNLRLARPAVLVDINPVEAPAPRQDGNRLILSAMTRHSRILDSETVRRQSPLLTAALAHVGNVRVRNRGTVGGTLAHGEGTSEVCTVSLALNGEITARGPAGERTIRSEDFFLGLFTTALEPNEVVTGLSLDTMKSGVGWSFHEMVRRSSDYAVVGVGASVEVHPVSGVVVAARIGLGGVADRPMLASEELVGLLLGEIPSDVKLAEVARAAAASMPPRSDVHASGAYRQRLVEVLTRRALREAVRRAHESLEVA